MTTKAQLIAEAEARGIATDGTKADIAHRLASAIVTDGITRLSKSATGVDLIDGQPFFAEYEGVRMNRQHWLDATAEDRKAGLIADLLEGDPA